MAFAAGQHLTAQLLNATFPEEETDNQLTSGTTTSNTYTATLTGGTTCGVTAVVPRSGKVLVLNTAQVSNSSASGTALCCFEVRSGGTIGSGTVLYAANDDDALNTQGNAPVDRKTVSAEVSGLTPGNTINVRQMFRVNNNTGTYFRKELTVLPVT